MNNQFAQSNRLMGHVLRYLDLAGRRPSDSRPLWLKALDALMPSVCMIILLRQFLNSPGRGPGPMWHYPVPSAVSMALILLFGATWWGTFGGKKWAFALLTACGAYVLWSYISRSAFPFTDYQYLFGPSGSGSIRSHNNDTTSLLFIAFALYNLLRLLFPTASSAIRRVPAA